MTKKLLILALALACTLSLTACTGEEATSAKPVINLYPAEEETDAKPVIYLNPTEETVITVRLDYDGRLTTTYPAYEDGWTVTAQTDGTLTNQKDGREYSYLFWEGVSDEMEYDFSQGFCVKGEDTAAFLQEILPEIGLIPREYNEFIVYWLPRMEGNAYNLISFQGENYTEHARLTVTPEPESLLRVYMAWKPLDEAVEIAPQTFSGFERSGFTVVEWGGCEVKG